jgi:D-sedoheptulose 7-phosphate isomerase
MARNPRAPLEIVEAHFLESAAVKEQVAAECGEAIVRASELIAAALRDGRKVLLCGNGGSAADCQHIAAEFVSVLDQRHPRPALPAIALTTDTSFLTANANDFGFENVFSRQIEALGGAGDVLVAISTSGRSPNVLAALRRARERKLKTIGLSGRSGGAMNDLGDVMIRVPSESTQHIQEAHITVGHLLVELAEVLLFGANTGR